jgi:hypothetical protein
MIDEQRLALIHRVMISEPDYPKEYAILVTNRRLIFIRLDKVRSTFALRGEMRWGSEIASPVVAKTLKDFEGKDIESLASFPGNFSISNDSVTELFLVEGTHKYHVNLVELKYRTDSDGEKTITFYLVPLGTYVKPLRAKQSRDEILKDYALNSFKVLEGVLPGCFKLKSFKVEGSNCQQKTIRNDSVEES